MIYLHEDEYTSFDGSEITASCSVYLPYSIRAGICRKKILIIMVIVSNKKPG